MRQLPLAARAYLLACYLAGTLALGWFMFSYRGTIGPDDWLLGMGLTIVSAACQVFLIKRARSPRSDHLTPAPLFAAVMLLPRPLLALLIVITFLPEWYVHRRRWFIQLFNIASYLIAAAVTRVALFGLTGRYRLDMALTLPPLIVVLTIPIFLGTQTLLLAGVLRLARGESLRATGLFTPEKLFVEIALVAMGLGFATSWVLDPIYGLVGALPLALFFQALHVPNLRDEATTDPKTGLANMRHFNAVLLRDLERAARSGLPVSVLMCDLDYLRNINNTYGHQAGDIVLMGIADILRQTLRTSDVAARFGGEEFVVLLTDADSEIARGIAERVRRQLEQARFEVPTSETPVGATISIGVASYPQDGRDAQTLMHEADLAVYQAKRDGRNRVAVAGRTSRELAGEWARENLAPAPNATSAEASDPEPRWRFVRAVTGTVGPTVPAYNGVDRRTRAIAKGQQGPFRRAARRTDAGIRVQIVIGAVLLAGLVGLLPGLSLGAIPWPALLLFGGLTVLAEQVAVDTFGRGKTSVAAVSVLSAAYLYSELGILITAVALAVAVGIKARSPLHRVLFNLGTVLLSAEAAHALFDLLVDASFSASSIAALIVPAIAAGLAYYAVNHALLCLIRGLHERRSPWQIWRAEYLWLAPHYVVIGALGLVVALGYLSLGWIGVVTLMAPAGMMHLAIKQYMDRTKTHVGELERVNSRLTDSYEATLQALTRALDTRDEETEEHSQRVRRYSELVAARLGVVQPELDDIVRGALLHDIGKIGVPDAILLKPGKLTEEERTLMRKHPDIGYGMIAHIPFLTGAAHIVLHHHEAFDGSGYPSGLTGLNIPLGARIFAVADTFDAMTTDRPYRTALPVEVAFAEIERCRGTQFDPRVVDTFLAIPEAELLAIRSGIDPPASDLIMIPEPDRHQRTTGTAAM